jgi:FkbM family methyltransferase
MLMQKMNWILLHARSVRSRTFHFLLHRLGIRSFREHSFFEPLLARPAVVADFGAHRGEFFAAVKSHYPISRALLVEADPTLAEFLKETFGAEADVLHAALVGQNTEATITFTRSQQAESSSIFSEWSAAYGIAGQVEVPAVDLSHTLRALGGPVDLAKFDIEGAEIGVLEAANGSDLASYGQLTVEFHDKRPPFTRRDVHRVCRRMRSQGYGVVNANWPFANDMLFVNLRRFAALRRLRFRCRMAVVNTLFVLRGAFFATMRLLTGSRARNDPQHIPKPFE